MSSKENKKFDINSQKLELNEELNYGQQSRLREAYYSYQDFSANVSKYFRQHPLIGYSFKRIIYGLLTLLLTIIIVFLLVNLVTDEAQYLPSYFDKLGLAPGTPEYELYLEDRMKLFGVYGPMLPRLFQYIVNLIPFIPKYTVVSQHITIDTVQAGLGFMPVLDQLSLEQMKVLSTLEMIQKGGMQLSNIDQDILDQIKMTIDITYKTHWVYLGIVASSSIGTPGSSEIMVLFSRAIPYSLAFGGTAVVISYLIGIPLGIQAAKRKGKAADSVINGVSTFIYAIPGAVLIIAIYLLSISVFGHSAMFGSGSFWTKFWPTFALVVLMTPGTVILTRRYVIDEMTADYTKFAFSKGMGGARVYYIHIFRNAGIRILRQFPIDLAITMFGASILTEKQWLIPGMSPFIVKAVVGVKDSFVILGFISFAAFVRIFATLIADLTVVFMDPRVSLGKK